MCLVRVRTFSQCGAMVISMVNITIEFLCMKCPRASRSKRCEIESCVFNQALQKCKTMTFKDQD